MEINMRRHPLRLAERRPRVLLGRRGGRLRRHTG